VKKFLEKRWWQGLGVIAAIVLALIFGIPQFFEKPHSEVIQYIFYSENNTKGITSKEITSTQIPTKTTEDVKDITTSTKLVDEQYIWKLSIDNSVINSLYDKANDLANNELHDSKLTSFYIVVYPYREYFTVSIFFNFYSKWTDRSIKYVSSDANNVKQRGEQEPTKYDTYRATFDELPWIKNPEWLLFLRKSYEKVSPIISHNENTRYQVTAAAGLTPHWLTLFFDGTTNQSYYYSWDGQGDPISKNW